MINDQVEGNDFREFKSELFEMSEEKSYDKGKMLKAVKDIKIGDILIIERAYVSILSIDHFLSYCFHCFKSIRLNQYFPCQGCNQIVLCSKPCSFQAWQDYHSIECGFLDYFNFNEKFHYSSKFTNFGQ